MLIIYRIVQARRSRKLLRAWRQRNRQTRIQKIPIAIRIGWPSIQRGMSYCYTESMNETPIALVQPLAYRIWSPKHHSFFYTDVQSEDPKFVDRWTGLFDKQGLPLYENDIIQVHYNWKFGWVRAVVIRDSNKEQYAARATVNDRTMLQIGYYCFADSYKVGNLREHPGKLVTAKEQFPENETEPWWLSPAVFRSVSRSCSN